MAVTRARSGLIVVGDSRTLRMDRHWRAFLDYCRDEGTIIKADPELLARFSGPHIARRNDRDYDLLAEDTER